MANLVGSLHAPVPTFSTYPAPRAPLRSTASAPTPAPTSTHLTSTLPPPSHPIARLSALRPQHSYSDTNPPPLSETLPARPNLSSLRIRKRNASTGKWSLERKAGASDLPAPRGLSQSMSTPSFLRSSPALGSTDDGGGAGGGAGGTTPEVDIEQETQYSSASDMIGQNYTFSARGLTNRELGDPLMLSLQRMQSQDVTEGACKLSQDDRESDLRARGFPTPLRTLEPMKSTPKRGSGGVGGRGGRGGGVGGKGGGRGGRGGFGGASGKARRAAWNPPMEIGPALKDMRLSTHTDEPTAGSNSVWPRGAFIVSADHDGVPPEDTERAVCAFWALADQVVGDDALSPSDERAWGEHVLAKLHGHFQSFTGTQEAMLWGLFQEMREEYNRAVKRGMVEYSMRGPDGGLHAIGYPKAQLYRFPEWWASEFYQLRAWRIFRDTGIDRDAKDLARRSIDLLRTSGTVHLASDLHCLWLDEAHAQAELVKVHTHEVRQQLPMNLSDFCDHVERYSAQIRDAMRGKWLPQVTNILFQWVRHVEQQGASVEAVKATVMKPAATVVANQLRGSADESLEKFVGLFERCAGRVRGARAEAGAGPRAGERGAAKGGANAGVEAKADSQAHTDANAETKTHAAVAANTSAAECFVVRPRGRVPCEIPRLQLVLSALGHASGKESFEESVVRKSLQPQEPIFNTRIVVNTTTGEITIQPPLEDFIASVSRSVELLVTVNRQMTHDVLEVVNPADDAPASLISDGGGGGGALISAMSMKSEAPYAEGYARFTPSAAVIRLHTLLKTRYEVPQGILKLVRRFSFIFAPQELVYDALSWKRPKKKDEDDEDVEDGWAAGVAVAAAAVEATVAAAAAAKKNGKGRGLAAAAAATATATAGGEKSKQRHTHEVLPDLMNVEKRRKATLDGLAAATRVIRRLRALQSAAEAAADDVVYSGIFCVHTLDFKDAIRKRISTLISLVMVDIAKCNAEHMQALISKFSVIAATLSKTPEDSNELFALQEFYESSQDDIHQGTMQLMGEICCLVEWVYLRDYQLSARDLRVFTQLYNWPNEIELAQQRGLKMMNADKEQRLEVLHARKAIFNNELKALAEELGRLKVKGGLQPTAVEKTVLQIKRLEETADRAHAEALAIKDQDTMLGVEDILTDEFADTIKSFEEELTPFKSFWTVVLECTTAMKDWMGDPLAEINSEEAENVADNARRACIKLGNTFTAGGADGKPLKEAAKAAKTIQDKMDNFLKVQWPLLELLSNPGIKQRHWDSIEDLTGLSLPSIREDESYTLKDMINVGLQNHVAKIEETCGGAAKEFTLEKTLDNMAEEWDSVHFGLKEYSKPYMEEGTYMLTSVDEIQQILDDHIVKTQAMRQSRFITPFLDRAMAWEKTLTNLQEIVDNWLGMQMQWMSLEPIFSSADIQKQLPKESKRFEKVDKTWRDGMKTCKVDPKCVHVAQDDSLVERLQQANRLLDMIKKGLRDYLETKQLYFPRFFFLSDAELLEILSETKDPLKVQPFLRKCFEGIATLQFTDSKDIIAMNSAEKERVEFPYDALGVKVINPGDAEGAVERWLVWVQDIMRKSLAFHLDECMKSYMKEAVEDPKKRADWVTKQPGQLVLCTTQITWTSACCRAMTDPTYMSLQELYEKCRIELDAMVMKVRGKLVKLERKTIGALVTLDVHALEVIADLQKDGVTSDQDFDWLKQLRYTYTPGGQSAQSGTPGSVQCRMINAERLYAYEYLGNSSRLVITPLTDRCYRTLMGAVHLDYGGAPEGPAGTGKTETTKDLGKAIAIQCVVYNCSDTLTVDAMSKFFKGLAGTGAWCCFDEFNRILLEVLSVVAQQILTIQRAKAAGVERFDFDGTNIQLNPTCCPFITMNPSAGGAYAGRAELPDNLKALFRTCAMMVPNYATIGQVLLYGFGYLEAAPLSTKIVATYKLCSEQLSSQRHYDYGMRAVIAVLRAAANLKLVEENADVDESVLMLRAIIDVNLPKFLSPDVPLFQGIVQDLFPGVKVPEVDRSLLLSYIKRACREGALQETPYFIGKVFEVYDMMIVRHGFMIVGMPFGAKTSIWRCLQKALTTMKQELPDNETGAKVWDFLLNPKSILMGQLYGNFDPQTNEWTDGILAIGFRSCAHQGPTRVGGFDDRKWVMFDGPVDAIWIENMNTVLDDNKKLCLQSGEMIVMSDTMSMMFETMDLEVASPATVSRVGVIFVEPSQIGWKPLAQSWLESIVEDANSTPMPDDGGEGGGEGGEETKVAGVAVSTGEGEVGILANPNRKAGAAKFRLSTELCEHLLFLFNWLMDPMLAFVNRECKIIVPSLDQNLFISLANILESVIDEEIGVGDDDDDDERKTNGKEITKDNLEAAFMFALVWSVGVVTDDDGRVKCDSFLREFVGSNMVQSEYPGVHTQLLLRKWTPPEFPDGGAWGKMKKGLPKDDSIYDSVFVCSTGKWIHWLETVKKIDIPETASFSSIVVPTTTTAQLEYLLRLLLTHSKPTLVVGPTGTGKSVFVNQVLTSVLSQDKYKTINVNFSAKTTSNQAQGIIDGKLGKRRKGVFGPSPGEKAVVFVDDLNMPEVQEYGAQPPIEILRQLMGHGGWYDLDEMTVKKIEDTQIVAAMGPPGMGGGNHVTPRFIRFFNIIGITEFDEGTLSRIFTTICDWYCKTSGVAQDVISVYRNVVKGSLAVYHAAQNELRPTPLKSHYTFNLRDFSKTIQGMLLVKPYEGFDGRACVRLWVHEANRVFSDRLVSLEDQEIFVNIAKRVVKSEFSMGFDDLFAQLATGNSTVIGVHEMRGLMFGDYLVPGASGAKRQYKEVRPDKAELMTLFDSYLHEYNAQSKSPMNLVMFLFAIEHTSRIARVLAMPGGNALLVGVGGSGRQSLSRLAAFMSDYNLKQIALSKSYTNEDWHDDLRSVLKEAGTGPRPYVFLFSDAQIKMESFVEDINNLLNSGEVPNLFKTEDQAEIVELMRGLTKNETGANGKRIELSVPQLYARFVSRVKDRLHIVLAFSPIGSAFRDRLRKFPSLINCCTIDWFFKWPSDALVAVAQKFLADVDFEDGIRSEIVPLCQRIHTDVEELTDRFRREVRRVTYVTPTSYLELIRSFKTALSAQRESVQAERMRYVVGLEKLNFATEQVVTMQGELEAMGPILTAREKATEELMIVIAEKLPGAQAMKDSVGKEAAAVKVEVDSANTIKADCDAELAVAIPMLQAALTALDTLEKKDTDMVRNFKTPPGVVVLVMGAVCEMLEVKAVKVPDPEDPSKKINSFWPPAKAMLGQSSFLQGLKDYDRDHIKPSIVKKIKKNYIDHETHGQDFTPERVATASKAAEGLCKWVRALISYDHVAKVVEPKKIALAAAEAKSSIMQAELDKKMADLKVVEDELEDLNTRHKNAVQDKEETLAQVELCQQKLGRATELITGLGGEKDRWTIRAEDLGKSFNNLTGDIAVSAGMIAYLGPFTSAFREICTKGWIATCTERNIPCSDNVTLNAILGDAVKIRQWNIQGLPTDTFSVDNGIVIFNSRRWPLCIDPQGQANKWIRTMEAEANLKVIKLTDGDYMRTVENAVQFGQPVLLENILEDVDPTLEPLLLKSTFKSAGVISIRLGDSVVEYSEHFRFYMTTKLRNPHYLPEVAVKVTLLNFMITPAGLLDQLLGVVVQQERAELAEAKNRLIIEGAENAKTLKECENKILFTLSNSEGNILEDEGAVNVLKESKILSDEVKVKQEAAFETEKEIDEVRIGYTAVANRAQILFFVSGDMSAIEPTYQYSLEWFINLFVKGISESDKSAVLSVRLDNIMNYFSYSMYCNICRSLLAKDKLLFSLLMTARILMDRGEIDDTQWYFLLTGGVVADLEHENPAPLWLSDKLWGEICRVSDIDVFKGLREHFTAEPDAWKTIYDAANAHEVPLPGAWNDKLNTFQKTLVLRCIRPDKITLAMEKYVTEEMGERYVRPPTFDLAACHKDSSPVMPLIYVLSAGSDPMSALLSFAATKKAQVETISLGQGQGPRAAALMEAGKQKGNWVVLQNCHLAVSWMPTLERLCELTTEDECHTNYRLWCTTYPSADFPVAVLQNGVKMALEPPAGLRANLLGSYMSSPINDPDFYNGCSKPEVFHDLLFGLCFFHAMVQERRKFGALGFNIFYQFNESDLRISAQQLRMFVDLYEETPFKALNYCTGMCNYGGRVTDDKDGRMLLVVLKRFYNEDLKVGHKFSASPDFYVPEAVRHSDYIKYIENLPMAGPQVFGLHENATITMDQTNTSRLFNSVLLTQSSSGGGSAGGATKEEIMDQVAQLTLAKVPASFDMELAELKYPVTWAESMNTVVCQELRRFNSLTHVIMTSLENIRKAVEVRRERQRERERKRERKRERSG